jgi:hypothetical protein
MTARRGKFGETSGSVVICRGPRGFCGGSFVRGFLFADLGVDGGGVGSLRGRAPGKAPLSGILYVRAGLARIGADEEFSIFAAAAIHATFGNRAI